MSCLVSLPLCYASEVSTPSEVRWAGAAACSSAEGYERLIVLCALCSLRSATIGCLTCTCRNRRNTRAIKCSPAACFIPARVRPLEYCQPSCRVAHIPHVTQDNTPPRPIFKSRLLRTKYDSGLKTTRFQNSVGEIFPNDTLLGTDILFDVEKSSFANRPRGCAILCHLR